jgi:hypothetical protein
MHMEGNMNSERIELKSAQEVKRVVTTAFPGYKKHNAYLSAFPGSLNINSCWDGGSRDEYAIVELATMSRKPMPTSTHPFFDITARGMANMDNGVVETDRVGNVTLKMLPEGFALVAAGTFCGKQATAHVYLNPANLNKFLAA